MDGGGGGAAHKGKTALNSHQLKGGNVKNAVDSVCGECMYDVLCAMAVHITLILTMSSGNENTNSTCIRLLQPD